MQAAWAETVSPISDEEVLRIEGLDDLPEPLFPGNSGGHSTLCLLKKGIRCVITKRCPCLKDCSTARLAQEQRGLLADTGIGWLTIKLSDCLDTLLS